MSTSTITVGGKSVTLVSFPTSPGLRGYEFTLTEKVGIVPSTFTGQVQAHQWPGAEMWSAMLTISPLSAAAADDWVSFLMELRGMSNAFQLGDVTKATPRGTPAGSPQVDNSVAGANAAMSQTLGTKGWTPNATRVLARGDQVQVGYRLYANLNDADADADGKAVLSVYPSLREQPADSGAIVTSSPKGLWRLAKNDRNYSRDITRLTRMSIPIMEYR